MSASALHITVLIATRTPWWAYALLALLAYLGLRRLRQKRSSLVKAGLAPSAFAAWSVLTALSLARDNGPALVSAIWITGALLGAATGPIRLVPRPVMVSRTHFVFAASAVPLIAYMTIFWTRYALEVWAAFDPTKARPLALAALAISASTAGRTVGDFLPLLLGKGAVRQSRQGDAMAVRVRSEPTS